MTIYIDRIDAASIGDVSATPPEVAKVASELEEVLDGLNEDEGDEIWVRPCRQGEAPGVYRLEAGGDEQILGFSIPVPDEIKDAIQTAWNAWCSQ